MFGTTGNQMLIVALGLTDKQVQEEFASEGISLNGGTSEEFRKAELDDQSRWRKVLEKAGLAFKG